MRGKWKIKRSNVDKSTLKSLGGRQETEEERWREGGRWMFILTMTFCLLLD